MGRKLAHNVPKNCPYADAFSMNAVSMDISPFKIMTPTPRPLLAAGLVLLQTLTKPYCVQDEESHDSQSVYDAEEEEDYRRPLWQRGYFRRLIVPFCMSIAMFVAAACVFRLRSRLVGTCLNCRQFHKAFQTGSMTSG